MLMMACAGSLAAQQGELQTIRGVVVDTAGQPIPGVTLKQKGARDAVTDDSGQFRLAVKKDAKIALDIRRVGLFPGAFMAKQPPDSVITLVMYARPQVLPATVVTAQRKQVLERRGFYERQRNGAINGYFLTPEDLEKRRPRSVTGAAENIPGVRIDVGTVGTDSPMITGTNGCVMTIYLDGMRLTPDSSNTVRQRARYAIKGRQGIVVPVGQQAISHPQNIQIDQILDIKSVLAIEVYPRVLQAPPEYVPPRNDCGVVLLWTTGPER
jgi:hypothetical protein